VFANQVEGRSSRRAPTRVLGIDPGLTRCGYAVIDGRSPTAATVRSLGVLTTVRTHPLPRRLAALRAEFVALIAEFGPDVVNDYLCDFIAEQEDSDQPFFIYYPMILPHWPFVPTPDHPDWDPTMWRDATREPGGYRSQEYWDAFVRYTDKMVGQLVAKLEETGQRENTLVIWTGDNGTYTGLSTEFKGQPYPGGKGRTTPNGTHVPLIVDYPGRADSGTVCTDLIDFTDILPTMLDAAEVPAPEGFVPDGRSFLPQVRGNEGNPRDWIYCYYPSGPKEFAMTKRYKLYADGRFHDLRKDFYEKSPIKPANRSDEQKRIAEKLSKAIQEHTRK